MSLSWWNSLPVLVSESWRSSVQADLPGTRRTHRLESSQWEVVGLGPPVFAVVLFPMLSSLCSGNGFSCVGKCTFLAWLHGDSFFGSCALGLDLHPWKVLSAWRASCQSWDTRLHTSPKWTHVDSWCNRKWQRRNKRIV